MTRSLRLRRGRDDGHVRRHRRPGSRRCGDKRLAVPGARGGDRGDLLAGGEGGHRGGGGGGGGPGEHPGVVRGGVDQGGGGGGGRGGGGKARGGWPPGPGGA